MTTESPSPKLTISKMRTIGRDPTFVQCVRAYLLAKTFAQCERERVDAYINPLFELYTFTVAKDMGGRDLKAGDPITDIKYVWMATDEQRALWYKECDKEHRAHGFTGPDGHCPALIAEHTQINTENLLLDVGMGLLELGIDRALLWGEKRETMLHLLTTIAINENKELFTAERILRQ